MEYKIKFETKSEAESETDSQSEWPLAVSQGHAIPPDPANMIYDMP